jgi:O-antigen ligase
VKRNLVTVPQTAIPKTAKAAPPTATPPTAPAVFAPPATFDPQWEADRNNPLRKKLFYFALAAIFIRFSVIHEALAVALNLNLYLLYFVMPPTILGFIVTGGIRRTLQARSGKLWLAFLSWLFISTVFSSWRGGSAAEVLAYAKAELVMLFAIAGLVVTWQECKLTMYVLGLAAFVDLGVAKVFMRQDENRVDLAMGGSTIGNANDLAAHLILMLGFMVFILIAPKIPTLFRMIAVPALGYGLFVIVSTGSRGALVALGVSVLFCLAMGSSKVRIAVVAAVPVTAGLIFVLLPQSTLTRLSTLTSSQPVTGRDATLIAEAEGSTEVRQELLRKSIQYTFQHPLFGVGPDQFATYEGAESRQAGHLGMWHQTHNMFTQISSECGIPALIFFVGAIFSGVHLAFKTLRQARINPMNADIAAAAFSLLLGIIGFLVAATFLNLGYRFYEPAFCGLCIVVSSAAQHEMAARQARAANAQRITPPWAPAQPVRPLSPAPAIQR